MLSPDAGLFLGPLVPEMERFCSAWSRGGPTNAPWTGCAKLLKTAPYLLDLSSTNGCLLPLKRLDALGAYGVLEELME